MIMKSKVKELETVQAEEPKLVVELALQEWEAVLAVIENSTSPHIQVKSVSAELVKQLQPQVKTTEEK
jgi:anti-sigma-K factor RskA